MTDERRRIRRILVGLDASEPSMEALRAAARLAAELEAELEGVFVEDDDLLAFANLPFSRVTGDLSARARRMKQPELERALRVQAQRARQAMMRVATTERVTWSFRVVRGNVARELLEAAQGADLLSLGVAGGSARHRSRSGSMARRAVESSPASVLIQRGRRRHNPAVMVFPLVAPDEPVLGVAASLAKAHRWRLVVVIPPVADAAPFKAQLLARLADLDLEVRWLRPSFSGPRAALAEAAHIAGGGVLVIGAAHPLLDRDLLEDLVERSGCSLLIVR